MVWPITSVIGETGRPIRVNNISAESPKASAGSTSGDMNSESSTFAVRVFERAMPSAAATPSTIDSAVVQSAIFSELQRGEMQLPRIDQRRIPAQRIARRREFEREAAGERHDDDDHASARPGSRRRRRASSAITRVERDRLEIVAAAELHAQPYALA